ncbi:MAG TPA: hypothetical protein VK629_14400 [Steroidobacteraceae bacterium]|nr:hypothetical protein [Steroidobacteraceae bacterium]
MSSKTHFGTLKVVLQPGDRSVQRALDLATIARQIRARYPRGADTLFVGLASESGFKVLTTENGIIAILIGLLVPAVQKVRAVDSKEHHALHTLLKPGGTLALVMQDGSVQDANSGRRVVDCEGYTYLKGNL